MQYICLYTHDNDLAESFKIFFEGKYLIRFIPDREDLREHFGTDDCQCQALVYDAVSPTSRDVEIVHDIKKHFSNLKVLMTYVYFEEKQSSEKFLANNVDGILYKPYDFGEVDRRLQSLLGDKNGSDRIPENIQQSDFNL